MAKRYGGKYSLDGAAPSDSSPEDTPRRSAFAGARVDPVGARANLLFLPAALVALTSLDDGAIGLALGLVSAAVLTGAAWLLRGGLQAEAAFAVRKVARRPALPRKMIASGLTGVGVAIAAYKTEPGLVAPMIYGVAAAALHLAAFGIDPLRSKGMEGRDGFQHDRVARVVDDAEKYLAAMSEALAAVGDRALDTRMAQFQSTARDLIRTVEEDPRDLTAARKYLGVYLMGARDATVKFADIYIRSRSPQARSDYAALLDDLDRNFTARTRKLLLDDRSDLNIEIEVLRDRLQREGVRLD